MPKQLIINAIEPREVRAAILENGEPSHFFIERSKRRFQKGNIYRARVTSIEPHLQAAFVELEKGQHGFLGLSDIILPDAGVSLINGQPAPPIPGEDKEQNEAKEDKTTESDDPAAESTVEIEDAQEAPKKEPKPTPVEISPEAGDMLLGLETDLNSPILEVEPEAKEETTDTENAGDSLLEAPKEEASTTEETQASSEETSETSEETSSESSDNAQPEEASAQDETTTSETKEEPQPEENANSESAQNAETSDSPEASNSEAPPTATTSEEDPSAETLTDTFEGEDVDTAIFSMEEETMVETSEGEEGNNEEQASDSEATSPSTEENGEEGEAQKKHSRGRFKPRGRGYRRSHGSSHPRRRRPNMKIEDVLEVGQYITVQITKEGIGNKAPMVSTFLSLAGHYMVLTPGGDRSGVSKQVRVQAERSRLKKFIDDNTIPERCGLIVRTAAEGISENDLKADIDNLTQMWADLQKSFKRLNRSGVIKQEEALAGRLVRDYYSQDIDEVWIDDPNTFNDIKGVFEKGMSEQVDRLHLYEEPTPIFYHYQVESAIKGLFNRRVPLAGGGSLIFDQNEAMLVIDVNSGTFKEGEDDEDTAFKLNLLACKEIARQVQMRDVGGIVMIDFVDMRRLSNRSKVEKELEKAFKGDKARINIMHIGALGVLQMSRQRTKDSLRANLYSTCPHCDGTGLVPSKTHSAMSILREIRGHLKRYKGGVMKVKTTAEMAMELLNTYKAELSSLEEKEGAQVQIDIDPKLKMGEFSTDHKNLAKKEAHQQKQGETSANKKKRRKRNKKRDPEASHTENKEATNNNANKDKESAESMTSRLEKMEKDFPSEGLGIIKAPQKDAAPKADSQPEKQDEPSSEKAAPEKAESPKTSEDKPLETASSSEAQETNHNTEDKPAAKKTAAKTTRKKVSKKKPAPKKDADSDSTSQADGEGDTKETKPKAKAKTKTSAKKKATAKKTAAKKTAAKTKKASASKPASEKSTTTEE